MMKEHRMRSLSVTIALLVMLVSGGLFAVFANAERVYQDPFIPQKVVVADGYLHVHTGETVSSISGCIDHEKIVYPDNGKYFKEFLAMAMSAKISKTKIQTAVGPCNVTENGNSEHPQITVMLLAGE